MNNSPNSCPNYSLQLSLRYSFFLWSFDLFPRKKFQNISSESGFNSASIRGYVHEFYFLEEFRRYKLVLNLISLSLLVGGDEMLLTEAVLQRNNKNSRHRVEPDGIERGPRRGGAKISKCNNDDCSCTRCAFWIQRLFFSRTKSISRFRTKNVNVVWWNFCDSVGEKWLSGVSQTHLHMFAKFRKFTILLS